MSVNRVYVLAPNMKEVLLYRKELKDSGIEAEVIRITAINQIDRLRPTEIHAIAGWSKVWEGEAINVLEYCDMFNIPIKPRV